MRLGCAPPPSPAPEGTGPRCRCKQPLPETRSGGLNLPQAPIAVTHAALYAEARELLNTLASYRAMPNY
jgi:hypothetical protein